MPAPTITALRVHTGRTLPCRRVAAAARRASAADRCSPPTARPRHRRPSGRPRGAQVGQRRRCTVLVVGSIHGNETAGRAVIAAAAPLAPPGPGVAAVARRTRATPTASAAARARTRAGSTSTATSRTAGAAAGRRSTPTSRAARAVSRAGDARAAAARCARDPARPSRVYYHQHLRLVNLSAGADDARRPRLRAPRRAAGALPPALPRHRHELAEPSRPGHERVRRRAARRAALAPAPARRHARAVLRRRPRGRPRAARRPRPPIVWRRSRSAPTASARCGAYSRRHYGAATARR